MKNIILSIIILLIIGSNIEVFSQCSSIYLQTSDQIIYGRNHDYYNPYSVIVYNPKNLLKVGVPIPGEHNVGWKAIYSSITISPIGVGYANSGMNEKGLAIGHMALPETVYPEKDDRPVILHNQWIQYMLDKCANTKEVIEEAKKIRISEMASGNHYFVGDAEGNTAIIEFLDGQMVVYTNKDMPYSLLCNDTYEKSMKDIKTFAGLGGDRIIPERGKEPEDAMAIGAMRINQFYATESKDIIQDAFDIQYAMRAPDSTPQYAAYGTQYSAVFDLTNLKMYFRTKANPAIREVNLKDFEDDCSVKAKLLDIQTPSEGIVNNSFVDYSIEENTKCIYKFYKKEKHKIPEEQIEFMSFYPELFECVK